MGVMDADTFVAVVGGFSFLAGIVVGLVCPR